MRRALLELFALLSFCVGRSSVLETISSSFLEWPLNAVLSVYNCFNKYFINLFCICLATSRIHVTSF